jgi:hypothetical protein
MSLSNNKYVPDVVTGEMGGYTKTTKDGLPVDTYLYSHGVETEIFRASDGVVVVTMEVDESRPVAHSNRMVLCTPERRESALLFMYKCNKLELKKQDYEYLYQGPEKSYINKNNADSLEMDYIVAQSRKYCFKSSDKNLHRHFRQNELLLKFLANTETPFVRQQCGKLKFDNHALFYFDDEATFQDWWNDFQGLRARNSAIVEQLSQRISHDSMKCLASFSESWYKLATELKEKWNLYTPPDMLGAMEEYD